MAYIITEVISSCFLALLSDPYSLLENSILVMYFFFIHLSQLKAKGLQDTRSHSLYQFMVPLLYKCKVKCPPEYLQV